MAHTPPSIDQWLAEAKSDPRSAHCGMYLVHNGVVRATPKREVREGAVGIGRVVGLELSFEQDAVDAALAEARALPGVQCVRGWINEGTLAVGDTMMVLLIGADIRPHAIDVLDALRDKLKGEVREEREILG